jgi:hypothetical protein
MYVFYKKYRKIFYKIPQQYCLYYPYILVTVISVHICMLLYIHYELKCLVLSEVFSCNYYEFNPVGKLLFNMPLGKLQP